MQPITITYPFRPRSRSLAGNQVADLFGLAAEEPPHVVAEGVALDLRPGDVVLFTGPSGSGKSSLLRAAAAQLGALDAAALLLPDVPLVDGLSGLLEERLGLLAACGLSEARLLLRTPDELSDGERTRFRLALALEQASHGACPRGLVRTTGTSPVARKEEVARWVAVDELAAVLDRALAKVLAHNVRRLASRRGVGFLLATTHDDLVGDLNPDVHVRCLGGGLVEVERRDVKKKASASRRSFGCRRAPDATGRTSLGGIIEVMRSAS